jgi:hypothetical protein
VKKTAGNLMDNGEKRPFFCIFFRRAAVFFLCLCCFSLFLYAAGARQGFTDKTQLLLLRLSLNLGLVLSVSSVLGIFSCFPLLRRGPRLSLILGMGAYLCLCAFGLGVSLLASFIIAAAGGNL